MANDIEKISIQRSADSDGWFVIVNGLAEYFDTWGDVLNALKDLGV